jgi:hypothetical protein
MPANTQVMVSDVMIIVDPRFDGDMSEFTSRLKSLGLRISSINSDEDMIEGTIESAKLAQLRKVDGVDALRTVFTYVDHPPG